MNQRHLQACQEAARIGGDVLLQWLGRIKAREKGPNDLVTEADVESQRRIRELLLNEFPNHAFLGEESSDPAGQPPHPHELIERAEYCWIVDPLDGTMNFVHGLPPFGVSIALAHAGEVVAGTVFDPVSGECFTAIRGGGAYLNGVRIQVSGCVELQQALVAASFPARVERDSPDVRQFVEVMIRSQGVRRLGSAALNLCYVAAGRLDAYWATAVKVWDVAAGWLIVTEAGGVFTHLDGTPFQWRDPRFAAAATPKLHGELRTTLADAR